MACLEADNVASKSPSMDFSGNVLIESIKQNTNRRHIGWMRNTKKLLMIFPILEADGDTIRHIGT